MCVAAQNCKKITKTPYFEDSRPFKVIDVDISKKLVPVLAVMSSMCVRICNHFHDRQANSDKRTSFLEGVSPFRPLIHANPFNPAA